MASNSFQMGRDAFRNISGAISGAAEQKSMDEILKNLGKSSTPEDLEAILQSASRLSPERQAATLQAAQRKSAQIRADHQRKAFKSLGLDPLISHLDPAIQKEVISKKLADTGSAATASLEKSRGALNTIDSLVGKPGIGLSGIANFSKEARFNRGKFKSTQAAILPLFKSMFPRGMTEKEFKFIQENYIPQIRDTDETLRGKAEGLKEFLPASPGQQGATEEAAVQEEEIVAKPGHVLVKRKSGDVLSIPKEQVQEVLMQEGTEIYR